jgi:tetratricopeptide (TPR) repeat protein
LGAPVEARSALERALELDRRNVLALGNLAQVEIALGDERAARKILDEAWEAACARKALGALDGLTQVIAALLPPQEALRRLDAILAADARAAITWNNRAILLRRMGRLEEALQSVDRALDSNPAYAKAWTNRANVLVNLGRMPEALECAERSIDLDPSVAGAYAARATALAQMGDVRGGIAALRDGLAALPGNAMLLEGLRRFEAPG